MAITEDSAKAFIKAYCDDFNGTGKSVGQWEAYVAKYHTDGMLFIRPSGNPMSNETYLSMLISGDVVGFKEEFIGVESVQILVGGKVACVFYTVDQYFTYKGTPNEDRAKTSVVLEEVDGEIKIAYGHRCTGQPIPNK